MKIDERPRCPECHDVLIEGECLTHGVIADPVSPSTSGHAARRPSERARVVTPDGGGPSYVVFEPEAVARERERRASGEPQDAQPTRVPPFAGSPAGPPSTPGADDVITISQRSILIVLGAGILVLLFVLLALWRGQSNLAGRFDRLDAGVGALDDRLTTMELYRTESEARLKGLERQIGGTINVSGIARKVRPAVFTVQTPDGVGSAFVVDSGRRSTLLTNAHVVLAGTGAPHRNVTINQQGRAALRGRVREIDIDNDLALIRVNRKLPALRLHLGRVRDGAPVIAVGSPLGLGGTVTEGIVSGKVGGLIQFSAAASPGSSGGPLVNADGLVIGIVTLKIVLPGVEGLSFAVPVSEGCSRLLSC